jgi:hypothetical protein
VSLSLPSMWLSLFLQRMRLHLVAVVGGCAEAAQQVRAPNLSELPLVCSGQSASQVRVHC